MQWLQPQIRAQLINAGDGWLEHPSQALFDAYTILEEFGDMRGRVVTIVGDILHSRVAGSQLRLFTKLGAKMRVVGPATMIPADIERVFGAKVYTDLEEALPGTDVISDLRVQLERAAGGYIPSIRDYARQYCITPARLSLANPGAIVLHPGPINRDIDISDAVMNGPQSRVERQVRNGLYIRMAMLYFLNIDRGSSSRAKRSDPEDSGLLHPRLRSGSQ